MSAWERTRWCQGSGLGHQVASLATPEAPLTLEAESLEPSSDSSTPGKARLSPEDLGGPERLQVPPRPSSPTQAFVPGHRCLLLWSGTRLPSGRAGWAREMT